MQVCTIAAACRVRQARYDIESGVELIWNESMSGDDFGIFKEYWT